MNWSPTRHVIMGIIVIVLALGGFSAWAVVTEINGAVVAPGTVQVEARHQTIQHPDGGIISEIDVRDGDSVMAGQQMLKLDPTELEAQQGLLQGQVYEALARMDRLTAEVLDAPLTYRPELQDAASDAKVASLMREERALFTARRDTLDRTLSQLDERKVQSRSLIQGYERQKHARQTQVDLIVSELKDQQSLFERGLTQFSRVSALQREAAELEGELGSLEASIAEAKSAIAGFEIEALRLAAERREEAQNELRSLQPQETELRENLRVVETRLGRLVLRAPMSGTVLGLQIHTIGGVVSPGSAVVSIVPQEVPLVFSVKIDPIQIDRVHSGQEAMVRFPNFNSRTTPSFPATVRTVSADTVTDDATGATYFTAELAIPEGERQELLGLGLQPGMPLEAFIQTGSRSPASILVKPMTDYLSYALRED
ncbi:hypothetical protein BFP70_09820 [Thioclava sp. SK-1]|uniref:HlyD family type I secretion periplasmic adaptor subunit n=1 Tax=Thioclava sp. SK-1 TaxID=1889770 RepID=UPI00082426FB|nr:HlyD family type I secretion periplasmic adaptor subunit [Thioclava sp. SK-1]OCX65354.1 hypothetical protein BFP70_09820 [Thioclava sp. SK-1]